MSRGEKLQWAVVVVFALLVGYFTYSQVRHAAGVWFGLMPVFFFVNERVLGTLPPFSQQRTLQTVIGTGYLVVLYVLLPG